jgi:hypothetical protein
MSDKQKGNLDQLEEDDEFEEFDQVSCAAVGIVVQ